MPNSQHNSGTAGPASTRFRTSMIWLLVHLGCFMEDIFLRELLVFAATVFGEFPGKSPCCLGEKMDYKNKSVNSEFLKGHYV